METRASFQARLTLDLAALETVFTRCAAEERCSQRYPQIEETYYAVLEDLQKNPCQIQVFDTLSGKSLSVTVNDEVLIELLFAMMYDPYETTKIPSLIDRVHAGDLDVLREPYQYQLGTVGGISEGMHVSVHCGDEDLGLDLDEIEQSIDRLHPAYRAIAKEDLALDHRTGSSIPMRPPFEQGIGKKGAGHGSTKIEPAFGSDQPGAKAGW